MPTTATIKKETFASSLPSTEQPAAPESAEDRLSIIMKLLSDPQTAELLKVLVNNVSRKVQNFSLESNVQAAASLLCINSFF